MQHAAWAVLKKGEDSRNMRLGLKTTTTKVVV